MRGTVAAAAALVLLFLAVYAFDAGRGFVKDDFAWILASRSESLADLSSLFLENVGFYRPLVSVVFAADHALWGLNPSGYGMTNVVLCLADAVLLFALAHRLSLPVAASLAVAAVWALNFHGINMAVLWISGRTALLVVLFALGTAHAVLRGRTIVGGVLCGCAMLCKEEAVLLPAFWTAFLMYDRGVEHRSLAAVARRVLPLWTALGVYAVVRSRSGAFALDAPWYYQFTFEPALLGRNLLEYADRAGTVAIVVSLVFMAIARGGGRMPREERRVLVFAAGWIVAMFGLTLFLPLRSSLYAVLPSVGSALIAGVAATRALHARPRNFAYAAITLIVMAALLLPVYRARNVRWSGAARLSADVMDAVRATARDYPEGGRVVLYDDPTARINFASTFDSLFPAAVTLVAGPAWTGQHLERGQPTPPDTKVTIALQGGKLEVETEGGVR